tara:strand:- start:216 stop:626 length:411 start_codon:yes stop_codon:yes gene_type:complete
MDIDIEKEAYIRASSHLLSEKLPDNYKDMTESQLRDYCSDKGIIPSYSPTETVTKIGELSADLISYVDLVEGSKLRDVCKNYVDAMVEATAITEAEGSEFYEEFLVEQDVVGSQEAFEKLSAHIQKTQKNSEPSEP